MRSQWKETLCGKSKEDSLSLIRLWVSSNENIKNFLECLIKVTFSVFLKLSSKIEVKSLNFYYKILSKMKKLYEIKIFESSSELTNTWTWLLKSTNQNLNQPLVLISQFDNWFFLKMKEFYLFSYLKLNRQRKARKTSM